MSVLVLCKFTPLGFETVYIIALSIPLQRVNLPRWGLKLCLSVRKNMFLCLCKFTPLGFET